MRCATAAQSKSGRWRRKAALQEKPRDGSRTRAIYDLLQAGKGRPVEIEITGKSSVGVIIVQLENFYGLDIRRLQNGSCCTGRKSKYVLAGEWFGRVYVDYIAEHLSSLSQHSSDGEQPLCRRKRADSSPAAGTNSNSVAASRDGTPVLVAMPPSSARAGNLSSAGAS